ncbi:unnamed protein product [Angiostrongylus costaricensis]|uniref:Chaoptin n=1 Tax=Angiostrongylus costaricensis TaxID=334426 RepID=A0A158PGI5_ANGCS|nr:unnamed protein product [Angiostrongylus costaricensis]
MIALKSALRLPRGLSVEWVDGMTAQFTNVWLRDNSLHMRPSLIHLDLNPCPQRVDLTGNCVSLEWPPFLRADFSSEFLRSHSTIKPGTNPCKVPNKKIPSVVTVETRFGGARVSLVDSIAALKRMRDEHPLYFKFMLDNPIEYEHAFFKATHHLANVDNNGIVSAVFNNDFRSSHMTTNNHDLFYRSLKSFYNICCETQQEVYINSDELLVVDNSQTLIGAPAQWSREIRVRVFP